MPRKPRPYEDQVAFEPNTGCQLFLGHLNKDGYGKLNRHGKSFLAHRWVWELHHGAIPQGFCVLHKCDTPACCNPDHLFLGTPLDNSRDCFSKGRANRARGQGIATAKLTEENVRQIRNRILMGATHKMIQLEFGISAGTVSYIRNRKVWRHVL